MVGCAGGAEAAEGVFSAGAPHWCGQGTRQEVWQVADRGLGGFLQPGPDGASGWAGSEMRVGFGAEGGQDLTGGGAETRGGQWWKQGDL